MRLNKFIAQATGLSRRAADDAIKAGRVEVNSVSGELAQQVSETDNVTLYGKRLTLPQKHQTILLNKPVGYVSSRDGQGNKTVYDLLPAELHRLKPVGRLDKDSSGLLLMTDDGSLANQLTHPSFGKKKVYEVRLDKPLTPEDKLRIQAGVKLEDGLSKLKLKGDGLEWKVSMTEGRNRQIRRTFEVLGYKVLALSRTKFGEFSLRDLESSKYTEA